MTSVMPAAVLWDMDGTLVDTEPSWFAAEREIVEEHGGRWTTEDSLACVGQSLELTAARMRERGVGLPTPALIAAMTTRVLADVAAAVPWRPGAQELLRALRDAGVPTALVTMSRRPLAEHVAGAIGFPAFDAVVTADDVTEPKPSPAPYLLAAELLGVRAADCVAIEDSEPGIASAVASGAVTVGVPHVASPPASADWILWETLRGRGVADIRDVFERHRSGS